MKRLISLNGWTVMIELSPTRWQIPCPSCGTLLGIYIPTVARWPLTVSSPRPRFSL